MNGQFIVFTTIVLVLYIFVIFIVLTPWFGMAMIPYMVIFTFVGAALILTAVYAYDQSAFDDLGWESVLIFALITMAFLIVIFVIWFFIKRRTRCTTSDVEYRDEDTNIPIREPYRAYHGSEYQPGEEEVVYDLGLNTREWKVEDYETRIRGTPI